MVGWPHKSYRRDIWTLRGPFLMTTHADGETFLVCSLPPALIIAKQHAADTDNGGRCCRLHYVRRRSRLDQLPRLLVRESGKPCRSREGVSVGIELTAVRERRRNAI